MISAESYEYLLAVDGSLDSLLKNHVFPHAVTGDFDSVSKSALQRLRDHGGSIDHRTEQETTDFEKAIMHLLDRGFNKSDVVGYHGSRIDHLLAVFHGTIKWINRIELRFIDKTGSGWIPLPGKNCVLENLPGCTCSIMPITRCEGVTLTGFRWSLQKEKLEPGVRISCSNEIIGNHAGIKVKSGYLFVYLHHHYAK